MSVKGYILVKIVSGKDRQVIQHIITMEEVKECTLVYGECDLVLNIEVEDFDELDELIFNKLRKISGVESTRTLIGTRKIK